MKTTTMSFRTYVRNLKVLNLLKSRFLASLRNDTKTITTQSRRRESGSFKFQNSILSLCLFWVALFFFVIKPLAFAEEKIPVFPSTPVEAYTIYASLAVFWLAIIGLIVIIKMKLNEIDRIQKLGIDKEDNEAPLLD
jgi:hypothetical protein